VETCDDVACPDQSVPGQYRLAVGDDAPILTGMSTSLALSPYGNITSAPYLFTPLYSSIADKCRAHVGWTALRQL
jgi:hypothetical protein